jgi:hypothetical protein
MKKATYASGRVANNVLAGLITSQDGQNRANGTPFGRNYRVVHTGDFVPTRPLMAGGFVHPGPVYNIATTFNVFSVDGINFLNFRQKLPPVLPPVPLSDVTRNDGPDTETVLPIPAGPAAFQSGFDHIFYFKLVTNCADRLFDTIPAIPLF